MITHYFKNTEDAMLEVIPEPKAGVWTHVVVSNPDEIESVIEMYGLDETIIEDISDIFEVPRFEKSGTVAYFFTRYPYDVQDIDIDTAPILFVIGETFLITITYEEVPFLTPFIEGKYEFSTVHKTSLFLEFMNELALRYEKKLMRTRKLVYRDMGRIRSIRGKDIQRLVFFEQELNETISALLPTNTWLNQIAKGNAIQMFANDRELLEDLLIANNQLVDSAQSILKTIQNIRGASEAMLSQNLNSTIRKLTAFTIVLTIPTLIASLFGMNVPVPLQNHPYAFPIVLAFVAILVGITLYLFDKNRWI